jgi:NhaA family Na+:H+ antiporter
VTDSGQRRFFDRGSRPEASRIAEILRRETVGGAVLLIATVLALVWANSPWSDVYADVRDATFGIHALHLDLSVGQWAADGLLAVFFFVAGLELKREFVAGDLRDVRRAAVPVVAAVSGVAVPALIYAAINLGAGGRLEGWAVPTATDIAFALAVLAVVGSHLPSGLRTFLLTLAVVDDLLAITIIALFYTRSLSVVPLLLALLPLALFALLAQKRRSAWYLLAPLAAATWALVHASGIHATVAGVLLAFTVPVHRSERNGGPSAGPGMAEYLEHRLRPISSGFAVPVFAFFSAGVTVGGLAGLTESLSDRVTIGVIVALVVGKTIGVFGSTYLLSRFTRARLDDDLSWIDVVGLAMLAGVGFTVSLLIGELAFGAGSAADEHVKVGVLLGSVVAAALAAVVLRARNSTYRRLAALDAINSAAMPAASGHANDGSRTGSTAPLDIVADMTQVSMQTTRPAPLPHATPESQGLPSAAIEAFLDAIEESGVELHSLMVLRHGNVLAQGWWEPYTPDGLHLLYSLSKSFTSTAIGLAVGEGLLSIDDLVTSFFPEIDVETLDPKVAGMQVRHILSMASGHHADTLERIRLFGDEEPAAAFLSLIPEEEPGTWFTYNNGCTLMLSVIITRLTGLRVLDYLRPRLFEPLGIGPAYWAGIGPIDLGFSGLHLQTDAIARLGQLYLQDGVWNGRQLLPVGWVAQASAVQVDNPREPNPDWRQGYGFQFWRTQHNGFRGDGAYGQFCVVLPDVDAVIAITAATDDMQAILDAVWAELLPRFGDTALSEAAGGSLTDRLQGLTLAVIGGSPSGPGDGPSTVTDESAGAPISSVSVSGGSAEPGWTLSVSDGDADYQVPCGFGEWRSHETTVGDGAPFATAACGAWTDAHTFTAELAMINTPHRLTILCDVDAGTLSTVWRTAPLGPTRPSHLALRPR